MQEITCTLCGYKAPYVGGQIRKEMSAYFKACKLADERPDSDCPRLQDAIDRATRGRAA